MSEKRRTRKTSEHLPEAPHMVQEARAVYRVEPHDAASDHAVTRLSSKNQLTLPVAMVRALGLVPGDEINLRVLGDTIYVSRRPQTAEEWIAKFSGNIHVPGWETQEKIDAYVQRERDSWTREGDDF